jgi:hypothetical protein
MLNEESIHREYFVVDLAGLMSEELSIQRLSLDSLLESVCSSGEKKDRIQQILEAAGLHKEIEKGAKMLEGLKGRIKRLAVFRAGEKNSTVEGYFYLAHVRSQGGEPNVSFDRKPDIKSEQTFAIRFERLREGGDDGNEV